MIGVGHDLYRDWVMMGLPHWGVSQCIMWHAACTLWVFSLCGLFAVAPGVVHTFLWVMGRVHRSVDGSL
jgi:hypothetical protein